MRAKVRRMLWKVIRKRTPHRMNKRYLKEASLLKMGPVKPLSNKVPVRTTLTMSKLQSKKLKQLKV